MRRQLACSMLLIVSFSAGCYRDATRVTILPGGIVWVEWPAAVSPTQPGVIRVWGAPECPQFTFFGVSVSGAQLQVHSTIDISRSCVSLSDTLVELPRLVPPISGLPAQFTLWAPVVDFSYVGPFTTTERLVGEIGLRSTPDTATLFAGIVYVYRDSSGCWRAIPTRSSRPIWTFAEPPPLVAEVSGRVAFLRGRLVSVITPVCGDTMAIDVFALEVDATSRLVARPQPRARW